MKMNKSFKLLTVICLTSLMGLSGCETMPKDALQLSPQSLENRQIQTRQFNRMNEEAALAAAAGVLQDMGFSIVSSETKLGLVVGNKERSAKNAGQITGALLLTLASGVAMDYDNKQKIIASLVTSPVRDSKGIPVPNTFNVRITFARIVWNTANVTTKAEQIKDPALYQEFFDKFSKAIFIDGQKI